MEESPLDRGCDRLNNEERGGSLKRKPNSPSIEQTKRARGDSCDLNETSDEDEEYEVECGDTRVSVEDGATLFCKLVRTIDSMIKAKKSISLRQMQELAVIAGSAKDEYFKVLTKNGELTGKLKENRRMTKELQDHNYDLIQSRTEMKCELDSVKCKAQTNSNIEQIIKVTEEKMIKEIASARHDFGPRSYAEVIAGGGVPSRKEDVKKPQPVLLVYPKKEFTSEETRDFLKKSINPREQGLKISKMSKIRGGGVLLEVGDLGQADKIKNALGDEVEVRSPKKKRPKLLVYDLPREATEAELVDALYLQNFREDEWSREEFGKDFRPLFKTGPRDKEIVNWVVEVSPELRKVILRSGRLYHGFSSSKAVDHLILVRCFQCQRFGHLAKECKQNKETCGYCSEEGHGFENCPNKGLDPKCANCSRMGLKNTKHETRFRDCGVYLSEKSRVQRQTVYE